MPLAAALLLLLIPLPMPLPAADRGMPLNRASLPKLLPFPKILLPLLEAAMPLPLFMRPPIAPLEGPEAPRLRPGVFVAEEFAEPPKPSILLIDGAPCEPWDTCEDGPPKIPPGRGTPPVEAELLRLKRG